MLHLQKIKLFNRKQNNIVVVPFRDYSCLMALAEKNIQGYSYLEVPNAIRHKDMIITHNIKGITEKDAFNQYGNTDFTGGCYKKQSIIKGRITLWFKKGKAYLLINFLGKIRSIRIYDKSTRNNSV